MYTRKIVDGMLGDCLSSLHAKLAAAVNAAVDSALRGAHLSLSLLARALKSETSMRHRIKRIDRLLGNTSLHSARFDIYQKVAARWLAGVQEILVLIDWSVATDDQGWHLLRASVAVEGRSVTLYEEIHPQRKYGNLAVHRRFLNRVEKLLPIGCVPVIVTDAGFRSTWFDLVAEHQWQWIGRIRGRDMVSIAEGAWQRCTALYSKAKSSAQAFVKAKFVRGNPTACRLVLVKREDKKRHCRTRTGKRSRSGKSLKISRRAREPWLLACSPGLSHLTPTKIVALYAKRMRIEQSFRDLKNERLGLGFSASRSRSGKRLEILLLISHLVGWLMRLIGECAQRCQMQKYFQSVPGLKHKEISALTLARRVIDEGEKWLGRLTPCEGVAIIHQQAEESMHTA